MGHLHVLFGGKCRVSLNALHGRKPYLKWPTSCWTASGISPRYDVAIDQFSIYANVASKLTKLVKFARKLMVGVAKVVYREKITVRYYIVKVVVRPVITEGRLDNGTRGVNSQGILGDKCS